VCSCAGCVDVFDYATGEHSCIRGCEDAGVVFTCELVADEAAVPQYPDQKLCACSGPLVVPPIR
jgi:hypothetical protein